MYKHSDPTHLAFGKSADSSLLMKKRYAVGGLVRKPDSDEPLNEGEYPPENPTLNQRRQQMQHSDDPILELEKHRGLSKKQEPDKFDPPEEDDSEDI